MADYEQADGKTTAPWAFISDKITRVVIGEGVTKVGNNAFYGCTALNNVFAMFSVCPSSPMVCTARHSSPLNTYTVTGYATVASPPTEPPERVRTCSTEFAA